MFYLAHAAIKAHVCSAALNVFPDGVLKPTEKSINKFFKILSCCLIRAMLIRNNNNKRLRN